MEVTLSALVVKLSGLSLLKKTTVVPDINNTLQFGSLSLTTVIIHHHKKTWKHVTLEPRSFSL